MTHTQVAKAHGDGTWLVYSPGYSVYPLVQVTQVYLNGTCELANAAGWYWYGAYVSHLRIATAQDMLKL